MLRQQTRSTEGSLLVQHLADLIHETKVAQKRTLEAMQELARKRYRIVDERLDASCHIEYEVETRAFGETETWTHEQALNRLGLEGIEEWVNNGRNTV